MEAIREPLVLVQGEFPRCVITPTRVTQTYLDLAESAGAVEHEDQHDPDQVPGLYQARFEYQPEITG